MKNNPQAYQGIEFDKPTNEIVGSIQARERIIHTGVALAAQALMTDPEMRRLMYEQANKPVSPAPAATVTVEAVRPTATEMLAQVANSQHETSAQNILASDPDDPEVLADNLRNYIDTLHDEDRRNAA